MSSTYTLWCLIDGDNVLFSVDILIDRFIDNLKDSIKQKCTPDLDKFDAADLILWKIDVGCDEEVKGCIAAGQYQPQSLLPESLFAMDTISDVWPESPPKKHLHVFISLPIELSPAIARTAASLAELSPAKRPRLDDRRPEGWGQRRKVEVDRNPPLDLPWLRELHSKIWNRIDLKRTLFRTVKVTKADYEALQQLLNGLRDCNTVKLNFLQSLSTTDDLPNLGDDEGSEAEVEDNNDDLEETVIDKLFPSVFKTTNT